MTPSDQKQVVHYLLTQMTMLLLAKSPVRDGLQKAATLQQDRLRAKLTKEEYEPIGVMRDILAELAKKLASCPDVETLEHTMAYIEALNAGEVMIAVRDPARSEAGRYEPNK